MADEQVPLYPEGGSLEDDLRRIATAQNGAGATTPTTYGTIAPPPPTTTTTDTATVVDSGDPDTDALIQRLLREDAAEAAGSTDVDPDAVPAYNADADTSRSNANIVETFFDCIKNSNSEMISALIDGEFVKVDTKSSKGETPLVAAVRANHVRIVQQLVDYGADVNEMSAEFQGPDIYYYRSRPSDKYDFVQRTPLMVAAENGHLPLVKLFFEVFHAKDDIVPVDGMTALRLAAQNGHREIVDYLPSRRIGGMQRWKYKNRKSVRRAKRIVYDIYKFNQFIFYEIPKFFVWSIPKHVIVLPIKRTVVYLWKNKKKIAIGIKDVFVETAKWLARTSKKAAIATGKGIKALPGATLRAIKATGRGSVIAAKGFWKFVSKDLPHGIVKFVKWFFKAAKKSAIWTKNAIIEVAKALKRFAVWLAKQLWKTLTVRIPKALKAMADFVITAVKYCGSKLAEFAVRVASAIHTLVTKVISWVSGITWKDVLNGFLDILEFIFVEIPKTIGLGFYHAGKMIKKILESLFGFIGTILYYLGLGILMLVTFVPMKIFELIMELFGAMGRGLHEVAVWINPKTI